MEVCGSTLWSEENFFTTTSYNAPFAFLGCKREKVSLMSPIFVSDCTNYKTFYKKNLLNIKRLIVQIQILEKISGHWNLLCTNCMKTIALNLIFGSHNAAYDDFMKECTDCLKHVCCSAVGKNTSCSTPENCGKYLDSCIMWVTALYKHKHFEVIFKFYLLFVDMGI